MDLKTRATNILTKPATEWPAIASEVTTPTDLITSYAMPLSAIPAICGFIGLSIVGMSVPLMASPSPPSRPGASSSRSSPSHPDGRGGGLQPSV